MDDWGGLEPRPFYNNIWWDARVVEWAALEMRYTRKGIGGSNPSPTVNNSYELQIGYKYTNICMKICNLQ